MKNKANEMKQNEFKQQYPSIHSYEEKNPANLDIGSDRTLLPLRNSRGPKSMGTGAGQSKEQ